MPKRSTVKQLPQTVKDWLDAALVENNFSDYSALEEALKSRGYDISRSAVHRYGQALERRLASVKASTEAAKIISDNISNDKGTQSDAILEMIQSEDVGEKRWLECRYGRPNPSANFRDHCINGKPHRNSPHARRVVALSAKMVRRY